MKTISPVTPTNGDSSNSPIKTALAPASLTSRMRQRDLSCIIKTSSSPTSLASDISSQSPTKLASSPTSLTGGDSSGIPIKTASSPASLAGGSSGSLVETSSGVPTISKGVGQKAATAAALATPLTTGTVVGVVAAGFYGISNMIKYARNEKSGKQAAKDTVKGAAGLGVSAGLGIAAANAVAGTSLALGGTVIVPMAAGVAAAYASIKVWHKLFFKEKSPPKTKSKTK